MQPPTLDLATARADFPVLAQTVYGKPLVYLDNAATTQKPRAVIDRLVRYYTEENANIHRGVHFLSQQGTDAYEGARSTVRAFINAAHDHEVIFVRGCTEGINLVAATYGRANVRAGDEIVVTALEHHSNLVPWQLLCEATGATLRIAPVDETGQVDLDAYTALLSEKTRIVSFAHISNALGTILPVRAMIEQAHAAGAVALVDGAQAAPHLAIDVQALDADFYVFSGHKVFGPTGIGVLYGKTTLLDAMPPYQGGGDMIDQVTYERSTWNALPHKFEAGTPHIAGVIGLEAALQYVTAIGRDAIAAYEHDLLAYATARVIEAVPVRLVGTADEKASVLSFLLDGHHPYDVGTLLDQMGIAVRTGHHCAQPLMERFAIPGTVRASFALYNTREDIDRLTDGLSRAARMLG